MSTEKISPRTMEEKNNRIKGEADELFRQAVESDRKASEKRRKQYNRKCSFKPFTIGSQIWKRNMRAKTFADRWVGPYVIIRPTSMTWTTYIIRLNSGRKEEIVHYNYLKPNHVRNRSKSRRRSHETYPRKNLYQELAMTANSKSEITMIGNIRSEEEDHSIDIHAVKKGVV